MLHVPRLRGSIILGAAMAAVFLLPAVAVAHADLQSSVPTQGSIIPSPFGGPIVLTFSEPLAQGSKADLMGSDGATVASATVEAHAMTMSIALTTPLDPGAYEVRWVSIADDGDILRQPIVKFTVTPASVSSVPPRSLAPTPERSGSGDTTGSGGDVVVPIIVALIVLGAGATYLLSRRNRPADPT